MSRSSAGVFERELKNILSGKKNVVEKLTKTCNKVEKDNYLKISRFPFIVVRAAGSMGFADLVALRGDLSFLVQIKTSIGKEVFFIRQKGDQRQAEDLKKWCEKTGVLPIYAYRLKGCKGDSWRVYSLSMEGLNGVAKLIHSKLPMLRETDQGNYIMSWESGMKLSDFFLYLSNILKPKF